LIKTKSHRLAPGLALGWIGFWLAISPLSALIFTDATSYRLARCLKSPNWPHLLGFDAFGRDLFLVTARAGINSLSFAALVVAVSIALSVFFSGFIASAPETIKYFFLRILDFSLAFPSLLIAMGWAAIRGPGWSTLWFSLLLGSLPMLTRLLYARTQELLVQDFIEASSSLGASKFWILTRHILPSVFSTALVKAPMLFANILMAEATLSFLGLGAPIGKDTWGSLLAQAKDYLIEAPHLAIGIGLPLVFTILSLQRISDSFET
jgi:peptide/nickel transport system permease protein